MFWSDSTVVLTWLQSESCRYKVFVANCITEILDLTSPDQWRYVETCHNPADDITRGKRLIELNLADGTEAQRFWLCIPISGLFCHPYTHDSVPDSRKPLFCSLTQINKHSDLPDPSQFSTWPDLVEATHQILQHAAKHTPTGASSFTWAEVETLLLSQAQSESFGGFLGT